MGEVDAKKTGALIAARRKALGLTQKELAERLMVSDKAVSKWETGAGYPEVTMLPLLAETLGITVDELLAGEMRAPQAAPEEESGADAQKADGTPPAPSAARRQYAAEKLSDADDKLLFAGLLLLIGGFYILLTVPFGTMVSPFPLFAGWVLLVAAGFWHRKTCRRLTALGADGTVSRRRRWLLTILCGAVWLYPLVRFAYAFFLMYVVPSDIMADGMELWHGRRIDLFLHFYYRLITEEPSFAMYFWTLFPAVLAIVLTVVFVLAYRRMTVEIRFHPVACGVFASLPLLATVPYVIAQYGGITARAPMDYSVPLGTERHAIAQGMQQTADTARLIEAAVTILLLAVCLLLRRRGWRGLHGVAACAVIQYMLFWQLTAEDLLIEVDLTSAANVYFANADFSRGTVSVYLMIVQNLFIMCLSAWAICTLLSGLRGRPKQPAAPASSAQSRP